MKSIWKYESLLSPVESESRVLLGEGQTPMVRSRSIGKEIGIENLYFKLEHLNPTGSYKDRFAAKFISILNQRGIQCCFSTSSGNTGAALAAYSAAAKIRCVMAIVDGAPEEKLNQIRVYGASTYMIKGFGKDIKVTNEVFDLLESTAASLGVPLPISSYSYCSEGMEGVQTIAYEIMEDDPEVEHIFCPAGGGGLTLAMAKGVLRYGTSFSRQMPKVHCVQPEGNDTIASAIRNNQPPKAVAHSETKISGLQVPGVLDGAELVKVCAQLKGNGYVIRDEEAFAFHRKLALEEGIFCEPAGAVALAGAALAARSGELKPGEPVVCLVTGSGFKDMKSASQFFHSNKTEILGSADQLIEVLNT